MNCENTSALCPSSITSPAAGSARRTSPTARPRARGSMSAAVARRLAQPQQRLENLHLRAIDAVAGDAREQRLAIVRAQLVVVPPLRAFELALERLLGASRQLRRDLLLRAPQDERTQRAREPFEILVAAARASRARSLKRFRRSEQSRDSGTRTGSTARRDDSRSACRSAPGGGARAAAAPPSPTRSRHS